MTAKSAKERYVHNFETMKQGNVLGGALSTGMGAAFTGERVYVGIVTKKKGTGSKAHYHLDETFNYVLKGALKVVMDGEEFIVPTGALLHIPPKVVHTAVASDDGDALSGLPRHDQRRQRQADDDRSLAFSSAWRRSSARHCATLRFPISCRRRMPPVCRVRPRCPA